MEENQFIAGDWVAHKFLSENKKLFVAGVSGDIVTTRYIKDGLYYTHNFLSFELKLYTDSE